ncbi:YciI family protein [Bowmanella sp. Y26]|uniref:YciI family protein n=1 Tax=Bowmanella yangjiangensis TaxID=2811230 RepID=UPI001BDC3C8C|nr:YciI family protein [Bowmanella yangjiangensis]
MKFICLGYLDESMWQDFSDEEAMQLMEKCFAYDDVLRRGGHFIGGEALASAGQAVTLRKNNGKLKITDGPFSETKEVLGGILLLEARNMQQAIELMSAHPGVGVGPFEIRPADEQIERLIAARQSS